MQLACFIAILHTVTHKWLHAHHLGVLVQHIHAIIPAVYRTWPIFIYSTTKMTLERFTSFYSSLAGRPLPV